MALFFRGINKATGEPMKKVFKPSRKEIYANEPYPWEWSTIFFRNKNRIGQDIIGYFKCGTLGAIYDCDKEGLLCETLYYRMRQAESGRWNVDFAWGLFREVHPFTNRLVATDIVRSIALWSGHEWFGNKSSRDVVYDKRCLKRYILNERRI